MQKYITVLIVILTTTINAQNNKDQYQKKWYKVEEYELKGLPKSALEIVEGIYDQAQKDGNSDQFIKALLYKSKFTLALEENATLDIITSLKKQAEMQPVPVRNIIHSIIAELYYQYFQQNRWQFYDRTQTVSKVDSVDFRTWDLTTIFNEIGKHYKLSLGSALDLQQIDISEYETILYRGKDGQEYRPTLYDFLAHRALNFYSSDEKSITRPAYKFILDNPDFIADNTTFTKLQFEAKDSLAQSLQALKLFKNLTLFHQKDEDPIALIAVSLQRLQFVLDRARFSDKDSLYGNSLQRLREKYANDPTVTEIDYALAQHYNNLAGKYKPGIFEDYRFSKKKALEICERAIGQFPESEGAKKCSTLSVLIKNKALTIRHEKFVPTRKPTKVLVEYKNIDTLYFKVFDISLSQWEKLSNTYNNEERIDFIKKLKVTEQWAALLKNEGDYLNHSSEIVVPALAQGTHLLYAATSDTMDAEITHSYNLVQATDIALIEHQLFGKYRYQVVDRNTGKPLENARVNLKNDNTGRYNKAINRTLNTDKNGMAVFTIDKYRRNVKITIAHGDDQAVFGNFYLYENRFTKPKKFEKDGHIFMFTDRSIYRPGQPVHFKGIAVERENAKSKAIANRAVQIKLFDVNNQEISNLNVKTNEFGSFSGEFVLPAGGLTGNFRIVAEGSRWNLPSLDGSANISVEEYKRPKFEAKFEPITESFRLNDSITVKGQAIAYAGSNITDASVSYRVVRTAQFPYWWYWRRPNFSSEEMEITNGITETDANGNYTIAFKAIPDVAIDPKSQPIFNYKVIADVTDINGETRTAETVVNVGYHTLTVDIVVPEKLDKSEKGQQVKISTKNLNGEAVSAKGELNIYKLVPPKNVLRNRPWEAPDYQMIDSVKFKTLFPHEPYGKEGNPAFWKKGKAVFSKEFDTENEKEFELNNMSGWASGKYMVVARTRDKFGQEIKTEQIVTVYSPKDKKIADSELISVTTDKASYQPGEQVKLRIGSAAKDLSVTITVIKDYEIVRQEVVHLADEIRTLSIPVSQADLGGFTVLYQLVNINQFNNGTLQINVPYPKKELSITTETFRDKLRPGQEETWRFKIKGDKKDKVAAELLASMYDASLDQFKPHHWNFNPIYYRQNYFYNASNANHSFSTDNFRTVLMGNRYYGFPERTYDQLNWFGFSLTNTWANNNYLNHIRQKHSVTEADFTSKYDDSKAEGYVFGQVITTDKEPLPGVNVMVEGKSHGTQTDFDGNFKIKANPGETLIFTFIGFKSAKLTVTEDNTYSVSLMESEDVLEEVVVTGYGKQRSRKIAGARPQAVENEMLMADMAIQEETDATAAPGESNVTGIEVKKESENRSGEVHLANIQARKNLRETAFFYPDLTTDAEGNISFSFTAPESLTRWKLQLLAHTKEMAFALTELNSVTQKELMVMPNPPRFFRQGDTLVFNSKIASLSDKKLNGASQLFLYDAFSDKDITAKLMVDGAKSKMAFEVEPNGNSNIRFTLHIPDDVQAIKYKIVARTGDFTDGEENALPVLTNRMLVTETLPMWVRSHQTKTFTLDKLKNNGSKTLKHHKLSLELTSNPAWYAVQALPYLMEYPYECSEQTFARYYANALGSHVANSNPRIWEVFNQWKNSDALLSNLEKNEELKSLIIQETPWLRSAQSEAEQKKRIALLFDLNKMKNELDRTIRKLENMQMGNGGFPWFKGSSYPNRYITQHIATGFGHLKHLNVISSDNNAKPSVANIVSKAVSFLDDEILSDFQKLEKQAKKIEHKAKTELDAKRKVRAFWAKNHTGPIQIQYLYMRSFFRDKPIPKKIQKAVNYYTNQGYEFWLDNNLYSKGLIALIAHRNNETDAAEKILKSLKENAVVNEELGMYWKQNTGGYFWYQAPVETQALMIEAFSEISDDTETVDELKVWLLKNKQTNSWKTTKATSEAVYALLLQGTNWLEETELVEVRIGDKTIDPLALEDTKIEAGTGYFKTSWQGDEIQPDMATVTLKKKTDGIAWGALYWQYFEDLDKITSAGTPLQLSKKLFLKINTAAGEQLEIITSNTNLEVGDLVRVRIEIKVDRTMEFVHMKDMGAAGFEPVDVLSRYKWQDGLGYYQSTKDAATNFFFSYLPKGVYVFEYDLRVNNAGNFSNGITTIQSMYAPEFSSHSEGVRVMVK